MKKYIFFIIYFFIISCDDIGKGFLWEKNSSLQFSRHYGSIGYDYGWNAASSPFDDGIIIVGQKSPEIGGQSDLWAIKTDSRGIMEWEKTFGNGADEAGYDVIATTDGGFLFVGFTWSTSNEQQVYAIKTNSRGTLEWEKTYGGSMWEVGSSVIEIKKGGFIIAGFSNSPGISSGNTDMFLIKIDNNGNLIWQKAYGNQAFPNHEWAYDIIETPDEGLIIVGARDRYDIESLNALIIRTDSEGKIIWEKEFINNKEESEIIYSISKSTDGKYYLCSAVNSISSINSYQPKIIKIDGYGNVDWERKYNSNSKEYHQFRATVNKTGEVFIVGSSGREIASGYQEDAFVIKTDSKGSILWTKPYGTADADDWGWSIFETINNNIVFVGSTKSFGSSLFDVFLVGITDSKQGQ